MIDANFEEERQRQSKALNLRIKGLKTQDNPPEFVKEFLQNALNQNKIQKKRAWFTHNSLNLKSKNTQDSTQILQYRKTIPIFYKVIYMDEGFTKIQYEDLKDNMTKIVEGRKMECHMEWESFEFVIVMWSGRVLNL